MAWGEIAGEVLEAAVRVAGRFLLEFVVELLVKGPGYFLARRFRPGADPDGLLSLVAGVALWVLLGLGVCWGWRHVAPWAA